MCLLSNVCAISAYPGKVPVAIYGDTAYITMKGDENCKFAIDVDGYTLLRNNEKWYYAMKDKLGNVICSNYLLVSKRKRSSETLHFLQTIPKGLVPNRAVNTNKSPSLNTIKKVKRPAIGLRKALIVLMEFQDVKFKKSADDFYRLFNENDYHEDRAIGSVYDYYKWASYGQLELKSDILGPYTAQQAMSYYGRNEGVSGNDKNPYELFLEAIDYTVRDINLAEYDADGDGYVDNFHIIYAGYGEEAGASSNAIWAHEMTFRTITVKGMKIDRYSCAPELRGNKGNGISRIGPHCHEIGHALGAMDYYDTDYETGGYYQGTGDWDVMASGSWNNEGIAPADFNPYVKIYDFGWTSAQDLKKDTTNTLAISSEKDNIYRVNTSTDKDFFLLENRDREYFHSAEPGKGLLIFHVGPNLENRAYTNTINSTYPQQCYVVCASSTYKRPTAAANSYGNINSEGCPYPGSSGNTEFEETSTPAALTIGGNDSGIRITDIHFEGSKIVFLYGNEKDSDKPDDPSATPEEVYLWAEDFEQLKLPTSWEYHDLYGTGEFSVTTKLSTNDMPESPTAANGVGYAVFSDIPRMVIGEYRTIGCISSPRIKLVEGKKYKLSLSVRKYNKKKNISLDTLLVSLYSGDNEIEDSIIYKEISNQDLWDKITTTLPKDWHDFSIKITCNIDYGATIFIDNLSISEISDMACIAEMVNVPYLKIVGRNLYITDREGMNVKLYSMNGTCLFDWTPKMGETTLINLQKGCYIIKQGNGTVSKILID